MSVLTIVDLDVLMRFKDNIKFIYNPQVSVGGEDCKNILIKGDNKAILPELASVYGEKIKCIYIDPPYNNGDLSLIHISEPTRP